jgi:large subunit ribosomal protein L10
MSKFIKQMEMDTLRANFQGVRDLVVLSIKGLTCQADHTLRANLRKKKIRLQVIKNSLTRKVFGELGLEVGPDSPYWRGPTTLAWGAGSLAELSRALDAELKAPKTGAQYKDKVTAKGAIAEGQPVTFQQALEMPTREEAVGQILGMILGAGSAIAGLLTGPAAQVASQIQTISEREPPADEAAAAPAAPEGAAPEGAAPAS